MALKTWRRVERSPGYQRRKLFFKQLLRREIRVPLDRRVGTVNLGGWWLDASCLCDGSLVYSIGVGRDIAFDRALARRFDLQIHAFDPTPSTVEWISEQVLPRGFHFHDWAVAGRDGELAFHPRIRKDGQASRVMYTLDPAATAPERAVTVQARALSGIPARLGHPAPCLVKLDVEGAEYEVLQDLLASDLRPRQILVEFHHRYLPDGPGRTLETIGNLRDAGYDVIAVSETGREISFSLGHVS
ncbi:MAG TPA: FkbM family methyltransferase [Woeseiaceae bacterium]|nr:FkbM family methyltransferase [Woeseiaceae bacterium]